MKTQTSILDNPNQQNAYSREFANSSSIAKIVYEPVYSNLVVSFKTGRTYEYAGVSWEAAQALLNISETESIGRMVNSLVVRGGYKTTERNV
jgi:hypothetical protein